MGATGSGGPKTSFRGTARRLRLQEAAKIAPELEAEKLLRGIYAAEVRDLERFLQLYRPGALG